MRFKEWLLNEMPTIKLPTTLVLPVGAGKIASDMIDFRFEDWPLGGKKPPQGIKKFAAPLPDGRWINIDLDNLGYGSGVVDQEIHNDVNPFQMQYEPYRKIDPDWPRFAEFLYHYHIVKNAEFAKKRPTGN